MRPCSYFTCLHSSQCENVYKNQEIDFNCICKPGFYGKRCENQVNPCQNETCSGHGLCKVTNQTKRCECFGLQMFEGEKCERLTNKMIEIQTKIKTTVIISIIILSLLYLIVIFSDLFNYLTGLNRINNPKPKKQKKMFVNKKHNRLRKKQLMK